VWECSRHASNLIFVDKHPRKVQLNDVLHNSLFEGFFNINEKIIRFRDIKEVTLRKGFFQRMYDLGTIYLATEATGSSPRTNVFNALGFGNISASGVGVCDVRNPDETFERIRSIVDSRNV
jgi:hypothetical protein